MARPKRDFANVRSRPPSADYDANFDRIFRKKDTPVNPLTARQEANTPWETENERSRSMGDISPTAEERASTFDK